MVHPRFDTLGQVYVGIRRLRRHDWPREQQPARVLNAPRLREPPLIRCTQAEAKLLFPSELSEITDPARRLQTAFQSIVVDARADAEHWPLVIEGGLGLQIDIAADGIRRKVGRERLDD